MGYRQSKAGCGLSPSGFWGVTLQPPPHISLLARRSLAILGDCQGSEHTAIMVVSAVCFWIPGAGCELSAPVCPTHLVCLGQEEEGKSEAAVVGRPGLPHCTDISENSPGSPQCEATSGRFALLRNQEDVACGREWRDRV